MSEPSVVDPAPAPLAQLFQPSEYTTLLLTYLRENPDLIRGQSVCEIGTGNGVIATQAAMLGAASLTITDVEALGLTAAQQSLASLSNPPAHVEYLQGTVWEPAGDRRFDVVLANLPHFPSATLHVPGRLPSWATGGPDGRQILDPFIAGLATHLSPGGRAIFTHNRFVDIDQTRHVVQAAGLRMTTSHERIVALPAFKMAALRLGTAAQDDNIFCLGAHYFGTICLAIVHHPAGAEAP